MISSCTAAIDDAFGVKMRPPFGDWAKVLTARSNAAASRRLSTGTTSTLIDLAAFWIVLKTANPTGLSGLRMTATRVPGGPNKF